MQDIIAVTCSFCGKHDHGGASDLNDRGWRYLEAHEKEMDMPWWDDGMFETLAAFVLCSSCSQQARKAIQQVQQYMKDNPPPKGGS